MVNEIVARQIGFQEQMSSNTAVMKLAVLEELGEYIASMGYADWKDTTRDEKNMDIELIDIAIFAINIAYYEDKVFEPLAYIVRSELEMVDAITKFFAKEQWIYIPYMIFRYNPKLKDVVVAKQALNKLRQAYGYKQGDYIKDWNGEEDNTYLEGFYGLSHDEIYDAMEKIYTDKILAGRLVNVHD